MGAVQDATLQGHDGDFTNTFHIGWTAAGHAGGGALSDGGSGQFVTVPRTSALEPASAITIMCWINVPAALASGAKAALAKGRVGHAASYGLYVRRFGGPTVGFTLTTGTTLAPVETELDSATNVMNTGWHHIAATYDGTTAKIYTDGSLRNSVALTGNLVYDTSVALALMGNAATDAGTESLFGTIDDVRIFDTALTIDDIANYRDACVRLPGVFPDVVVPTENNVIDAQSTLATVFQADVAGTISAIYYWNGTTAFNGATIAVGLYDEATHTLLGSGSRTQQSSDPTGWVRVQLTTPVVITFDHNYLAAYLTPAGGHYSTTQFYFLNPTGSGHIHGVVDSSIADAVRNGRFHQPDTTLTYPTSQFNASSYFVDVEFTPS